MHEHTLIEKPSPIDLINTFSQETIELFLSGQKEIPIDLFPSDDHKVALENLAYLKSGYYENSMDNWDLNEALMTAELSDFYIAGGRTVVDCSAPFPRPDHKKLKRMSEKSGVNIVMCTGIAAGTNYWPLKYRSMSLHDMIDYMEDEIENGIENTVKPAHIKIGVDGSKLDYGGSGIADPLFRQLLQAASIVSANTGIMVTAHIDGATIDEQRDICSTAVKYGMPPERMVMAHFQTQLQEMNLETLVKHPEAFGLHLDFARELLDQGFVASIDCIGMEFNHEHKGTVADTDPYKIAALYHLSKEGYGDQLVFGTDTYMKLMTRRYGGNGMIRLLNYATPTLLTLGMNQQELDKITTRNPARLLAY